jgi:Hypothetical glycosyl hydrolase family 15
MKALRINGVCTRLFVLGVALLAGGVGVAAPAISALGDAAVTRGPGATSSAVAPTIHSSGASGGSGSLAAGGTSSANTDGSVMFGSTATSSGFSMLRFTPLYMGGGKFSLAQAVAIAKNYDVIAEHSGVLTPYVAAMHAANPRLKIVAYINGAFDQSNTGNKYPMSWYAVDAKGQRVKSVSFGNWLMLPTSAWGQTVAKTCTAELVKSKYDGCFLDTLGIGPLLPGYVNGIPINPATKKAWTSTAWIAAQSGTITAVKAANKSKVVVANGLADGQKFGSTQPLLTAAGMAMSEIWLRVSRNPESAFPAVASWLQDVNMLVTAGAHGESVLTVTKLWVNATAAQVAQWHSFAEATFLLGTNGLSAYCFTTSQSAAGLTIDTPWDHLAIGTPTGAYTSSGGIYRRTFTLGIVAVNPGTSAATINLGGSYHNLQGKIVTSMVIPAHTGEIFIK